MSPGGSGSLRVLRHRDFRLLFLGQGISVFGDRMVAVALAFAVIELGGSASDVGLVLAAGMVPQVATLLAGGVVADRTSRRAVMVGADLLRLASQATMAVLVISGAGEVWMLAGLAGVTGAGMGFFGPASTGLLPEIVPGEELQPANALRSTAVSGSEILGPAVAGIVVATAGAGWAIAIDATTFGASAVCLALLHPPAREVRERSSFFSDLREGWVAFSSRRWVWAFVLYFAIANLFWAAWQALGPVVAHRDLGGAAAWGSVLAAMGAGALVGSLLATRTRPTRPLLFVAGMEGLFGLPLVFLAAAAPVALLAAGTFLAGVGMMLGMSVWESTLQRHIPRESLSRVSSYDWFGSYAVVPLGLALWGGVADTIGVHTLLWIASAMFAASVLALLAVPDIWRFRSKETQATVT